ncbi:MAG: 4-alpha-glucanotransferase, partial [Chitinophagaceae bacterium]
MYIYFELSFLPLNRINSEAKVYLIVSNKNGPQRRLQMQKDPDNRWVFEMEVSDRRSFSLNYYYLWQTNEGILIPEENRHRSFRWSQGMADVFYLIDNWNSPSEPQNALLKSPFTRAFLNGKEDKKLKSDTLDSTIFTHEFSVLMPMLEEGKSLVLLGNNATLKRWDTIHPVIMEQDGNKWFAKVNFGKEEEGVVEYKYGIYDNTAGKSFSYEEGDNRKFLLKKGKGSSITFLTDNFCRFSIPAWRGGGVAVPVFSLRSRESVGIGEFSDIKLLADWAEKTGLKILQLLPVNDTTATKTWHDSYPYASISAFALNPVYINLKKTGAFPPMHPFEKKYNKTKEYLNQLSEIDYESVLNFKWQYLKALYK